MAGTSRKALEPAKVQAARRAMPDDAMVHALAETFRALSDPTRVRLVLALGERELCVNDLAELLGLTGSAVSHQLRLLRGQRLVRYRREGKATFYALDDEHLRHLLAEGVRHVEGA